MSLPGRDDAMRPELVRNMPKAVIEGLSLLKSAQCTNVRRRNQHVPRKSIRRPPPCLTIGITSGIAKLPSSGVRFFFGDGSERCDRGNGMHRPIAWIRFGAPSRTRQVERTASASTSRCTLNHRANRDLLM